MPDRDDLILDAREAEQADLDMYEEEPENSYIPWQYIDADEPAEGFSRIWVMQAYGYKFTKEQEYGTQVAFSSEPSGNTVERAQQEAERFMRSEGIKGDIRYVFLTYHVPDEVIPEADDEG